MLNNVVKLPVIYVGGKLPVTYRPLPARTGHRALVLKGVGQSLGVNIFVAPHHRHNCFMALFRDHLGELVPEENFGLYGERED